MTSFKWMVALDCSESACEAFSTALNLMDKRRDELFLISAIQQINVIPIGPHHFLQFKLFSPGGSLTHR